MFPGPSAGPPAQRGLDTYLSAGRNKWDGKEANPASMLEVGRFSRNCRILREALRFGGWTRLLTKKP